MKWSKPQSIGLVFLFASIFVIPGFAEASLISESEQVWLDEHAGEISFAPIKDFPPFLWSQYGTLFGISRDYLNYIQEKLLLIFPMHEPRTRDEILNALKMGESSFVSSLSSTPDRNEYLLFTRPYMSMPTVYVGKSGTKAKTGLEIVQGGYKVSVGNNYGVHSYLKERYPDMILVPVENNYFVLQNVLNGVTEFGAINVATLAHLTREHNLRDLKKIGDTGFELSLSFAVPKSMPELRNIIDNIIETMPKKTREAIAARWITDAATIENLAGAPVADIGISPDDRESYYVAGLVALLLLCLGFIIHYIFVRSTPRKDSLGRDEYVP
jgi:ABC-type amino acid transport substrate-binding protein